MCDATFINFRVRNKMKSLKFLMMIFAGGILVTSCYYDNEEDLYPNANVPCDSTSVSYKNDVDPILQSKCVNCHNANNPGGGYQFDSYSETKKSVDNSRLLGTIQFEAGYSPMPKGGNIMPICELGTFRNWVSEGALNN